MEWFYGHTINVSWRGDVQPHPCTRTAFPNPYVAVVAISSVSCRFHVYAGFAVDCRFKPPPPPRARQESENACIGIHSACYTDIPTHCCNTIHISDPQTKFDDTVPGYIQILRASSVYCSYQSNYYLHEPAILYCRHGVRLQVPEPVSIAHACAVNYVLGVPERGYRTTRLLRAITALEGKLNTLQAHIHDVFCMLYLL